MTRERAAGDRTDRQAIELAADASQEPAADDDTMDVTAEQAAKAATAAARGAKASDLLRLATAGSVDDGKSTLIGRLLFDSKTLFIDQLAAVERVSRERGHDFTDLALLTDGLRAEREQGITIDVAYRYFATKTRKFIIGDTPGHVQYTRNTVTGASTAELAVLLVDARNGIVEQTRRHAAVLALLRVPRLVLAINKIDLVDYDEETLNAIAKDFAGLARSLGFPDEAVVTIPLSALVGDNVVERSERTPWYDGPTLLGHLESVPVVGPEVRAPFRMPVQYVIRPRGSGSGREELHDYRGYAGQVASGTVAPGDEVVVLPGGRRTTVAKVDTADGPLDVAGAGRSVTILLALTVAMGLAAGVSFGEQVGWPVAKAQRRNLPPASRARRPRIF